MGPLHTLVNLKECRKVVKHTARFSIFDQVITGDRLERLLADTEQKYTTCPCKKPVIQSDTFGPYIYYTYLQLHAFVHSVLFLL